jgi:hypothetical protein
MRKVSPLFLAPMLAFSFSAPCSDPPPKPLDAPKLLFHLSFDNSALKADNPARPLWGRNQIEIGTALRYRRSWKEVPST